MIKSNTNRNVQTLDKDRIGFDEKDPALTFVEERGFEPRASRMRSERSTTELHPLQDSMMEKYHHLNTRSYSE